MDISAKITGIKYTPFLCRTLNTYSIDNLNVALSQDASFILKAARTLRIALSWWVSPKRTRSYPYARVYDTLGFFGKKVTIIPILKDEGKEGDRDFLQWDTVSLMSLLGIYTIVSYYSEASPSTRYEHKITNQSFHISDLANQINELLSYQSDALHWNLTHIDRVGKIGRTALNSYDRISKKLGVEMHAKAPAEKRIQELLKGKEAFMVLSRKLAKQAQIRESVTFQLKEQLTGTKTTLTIKNYLGGFYYFTCDEVNIDSGKIYLIEGKHTKQNIIPSLEDIKDGLLKMILFTNLEEVKINNKEYIPNPVLKLTSNMDFSKTELRKSQIGQLKILKHEAKENNFQVLINNIDLAHIDIN